MAINYANLIGIHKSELPAAIIFALAYIPLVVYYLIRRFRTPNEVFSVLSLLSLMRVVAFGMRAALAASDSVGENSDVVIAEIIIYSIGFSGLLESGYSLALDRDLLTNPERRLQGAGVIDLALSLLKRRALIRLLLTVGVILAIVSGTQNTGGNSAPGGSTTRLASLGIFLAVSGALGILSLVVAHDEKASGMWDDHVNPRPGKIYGSAVLVIIALMCIIREAYSVSTWKSISKQNRPWFWYPLIALPELLAVILFTIPGLVPLKKDLAAESDSVESGDLSRDDSQNHIPLRPFGLNGRRGVRGLVTGALWTR